MLYRIIDAGDVPLLIRAFMDSYELVAPVECDQGHIFDTIDDPNDVVLDYSTTIASPKNISCLLARSFSNSMWRKTMSTRTSST